MTELDIFIKGCKIAERGYRIKRKFLGDTLFLLYAEPKGIGEQDTDYGTYDIVVSVQEQSLTEHEQKLAKQIEGKLQ